MARASRPPAEPVFYSPTLDAWVLSRYEDVLRVLKEGERFTTLDKGPGSTVYGRTILHMSGAEHTKKSRIAARQLQSQWAADRIDGFLGEVCARLTSELPMAPETVDLKPAYCMWIPLLVIGKLMGVEDPSRFRAWYSTITHNTTLNLHEFDSTIENCMEALRLPPSQNTVITIIITSFKVNDD